MGRNPDKKVTPKMLREFWKHNIHPITGIIENRKIKIGNPVTSVGLSREVNQTINTQEMKIHISKY